MRSARGTVHRAAIHLTATAALLVTFGLLAGCSSDKQPSGDWLTAAESACEEYSTAAARLTTTLPADGNYLATIAELKSAQAGALEQAVDPDNDEADEFVATIERQATLASEIADSGIDADPALVQEATTATADVTRLATTLGIGPC
jgi:hypothetical protein